MKKLILIKLLLATQLITIPLQNDKNIFYIESWKKGTSCIEEKEINIDLNKHKPEYSTEIKDCTGKNKYKLFLYPGNPDEKKRKGWFITLIQKKSQTEWHNLLSDSLPDPQPDSLDTKDFFNWLVQKSETLNYVIPLNYQRIAKIENFYCIIQINNYHLNEQKDKLEYLSITVKFTNKNP